MSKRAERIRDNADKRLGKLISEGKVMSKRYGLNSRIAWAAQRCVEKGKKR